VTSHALRAYAGAGGAETKSRASERGCIDAIVISAFRIPHSNPLPYLLVALGVRRGST